MKIIAQRVPGVLIVDGDFVALLLGEKEDGDVFLTYALATMGTEHHILPSILLDDWGSEIKHLELYRWFRENGMHFPRAEVFGETPQGVATQYFLRDLELYGRYPTYAAPERDTPAAERLSLNAVLIPDAAVNKPIPTDVPDNIAPPLREARVSWWRVPHMPTDLNFITGEDPGAE